MTDRTLPPLPTPAVPSEPIMEAPGYRSAQRGEYEHVGDTPDYFTADQMRAYARAALGAEPETVEGPLVASSACPHCGYDKPHGHTVEQLAAYKRDREAADGYVSTLVKQPTKEGWYLCKRVSLFSSTGEFWQLGWERKFMESMRGAHYGDPDGIPEVCWWGNAHGTVGFHLRHGFGAPGLSGAETRRALPVNADLWRELP